MPKKKEGKPLPETQDMKMWKKEYAQMSEEEHKQKLKALGLGDEDFEEFEEVLQAEKEGKEIIFEETDVPETDSVQEKKKKK